MHCGAQAAEIYQSEMLEEPCAHPPKFLIGPVHARFFPSSGPKIKSSPVSFFLFLRSVSACGFVWGVNVLTCLRPSLTLSSAPFRSVSLSLCLLCSAMSHGEPALPAPPSASASASASYSVAVPENDSVFSVLARRPPLVTPARSRQPFVRASGSRLPVTANLHTGPDTRTVHFTRIHHIREMSLRVTGSLEDAPLRTSGSPSLVRHMARSSMRWIEWSIRGYVPLDARASKRIESALLDAHNLAHAALGLLQAMLLSRRFNVKPPSKHAVSKQQQAPAPPQTSSAGPAALVRSASDVKGMGSSASASASGSASAVVSASASAAAFAAASAAAASANAPLRASTRRKEGSAAADIPVLRKDAIDVWISLSLMWLSILAGRVAVHESAEACVRDCMPDHIFFYGGPLDYEVSPDKSSDPLLPEDRGASDTLSVSLHRRMMQVLGIPFHSSMTRAELRSKWKKEYPPRLATEQGRQKMRAEANRWIVEAVDTVKQQRTDRGKSHIGDAMLSFVYGTFLYVSVLSRSGRACTQWLFPDGDLDPIAVYSNVRGRFMFLLKNRDGLLRDSAATVHPWSRDSELAMLELLNQQPCTSQPKYDIDEKTHTPMFTNDKNEARTVPAIVAHPKRSTSCMKPTNLRLPVILSWVASTWATTFLMMDHSAVLRDTEGRPAIVMAYEPGATEDMPIMRQLQRDLAEEKLLARRRRGAVHPSRKKRFLPTRVPVLNLKGELSQETDIALIDISAALDLTVQGWYRYQQRQFAGAAAAAAAATLPSTISSAAGSKRKDLSSAKAADGPRATKRPKASSSSSASSSTTGPLVEASASSSSDAPVSEDVPTDSDALFEKEVEDKLRVRMDTYRAPAPAHKAQQTLSEAEPVASARSERAMHVYFSALHDTARDTKADIGIFRFAKSMMTPKTESAKKGQYEMLRATAEALLPYITLFLAFSGPCISLSASEENNVFCQLQEDASITARAEHAGETSDSELPCERNLSRANMTEKAHKRASQKADKARKGTDTTGDIRKGLSEVVTAFLLASPVQEQTPAAPASAMEASASSEGNPAAASTSASATEESPASIRSRESATRIRRSLREPIELCVSGPLSLVVHSTPGEQRSTTFGYESPVFADGRFSPEIVVVPGRMLDVGTTPLDKDDDRDDDSDQRGQTLSVVYPHMVKYKLCRFLTPRFAATASHGIDFRASSAFRDGDRVFPWYTLYDFVQRSNDAGAIRIFPVSESQYGCIAAVAAAAAAAISDTKTTLSAPAESAVTFFRSIDHKKTIECPLSRCFLVTLIADPATVAPPLTEFEIALLDRVMLDPARTLLSQTRLYEMAMAAHVVFRDNFDAHRFCKWLHDKWKMQPVMPLDYTDECRRSSLVIESAMAAVAKGLSADESVFNGAVTVAQWNKASRTLAAMRHESAPQREQLWYDLMIMRVYKEALPLIRVESSELDAKDALRSIEMYSAANDSLKPFLSRGSLGASAGAILRLPPFCDEVQAAWPRTRALCLLFEAGGGGGDESRELKRVAKFLRLYCTEQPPLRQGCFSKKQWKTLLTTVATAVLSSAQTEPEHLRALLYAMVRGHVSEPLADAAKETTVDLVARWVAEGVCHRDSPFAIASSGLSGEDMARLLTLLVPLFV